MNNRGPAARSHWSRMKCSVLARITLVALAASACTEQAAVRPPVPDTPPKEAAGSPVVRRDVPAPPPAIAAPQALPPIALPAGAQYVCVIDQGGERRQTAIEFSPKVAELCRKHPEMGPCQYERDICRRSGGRVFAANNVEITLQTEAEYDKKVMRVRFKAN